MYTHIMCIIFSRLVQTLYAFHGNCVYMSYNLNAFCYYISLQVIYIYIYTYMAVPILLSYPWTVAGIQPDRPSVRPSVRPTVRPSDRPSVRLAGHVDTLWQSHMARPYGSAIRPCHMATPNGSAIWPCHIS